MRIAGGDDGVAPPLRRVLPYEVQVTFYKRLSLSLDL